jgi:hypothetical protein
LGGYSFGVQLLHLLPAAGQQEGWEAPSGCADGPFLAWVRHHDGHGGQPEIRRAAAMLQEAHPAGDRSGGRGPFLRLSRPKRRGASSSWRSGRA